MKILRKLGTIILASTLILSTSGCSNNTDELEERIVYLDNKIQILQSQQPQIFSSSELTLLLLAQQENFQWYHWTTNNISDITCPSNVTLHQTFNCHVVDIDGDIWTGFYLITKNLAQEITIIELNEQLLN